MNKRRPFPLLSLAILALLPVPAMAEPATATVAAVGAITGIFIQRSQGPSTNIGVSGHAFVPFKGGDASECRPILSRYDNTATAITPVKNGDIVNVALKHVVIGTDLHVPFQIPDLLSNRIQAAIVANAFEMCPDKNCAGGFNFQPDSENEGRVVYFSNDIKKDQRTLSFGTLPMFGPFEYQGHPVGLSLNVVKVANDQSAKIGPMLTSLAAMGQQSSYSADVASVLNSLGSNLLKGFDVRLLRYDTMLMPGNLPGDLSLGVPKFLYGDYIIVRSENRGTDFDFSHYRYSPKTAKLYQGNACTPGKEAVDVTYGVIQTFKGDAASHLKVTRFADLRRNIEQYATAQAANLPAQALANLVRDSGFRADLMLLRASPSFASDGNQLEKEALLAVLNKLSASGEGKDKPEEGYSPEEVKRLRNALFVATEQTIAAPLVPETVYEQLKSKWR